MDDVIFIAAFSMAIGYIVGYIIGGFSAIRAYEEGYNSVILKNKTKID